jgi:hypothetical protein
MADSPLTNPRSLVTSTAFHAALLVAASLAVLRVLSTDATVAPGVVLEATPEPLDNRVPSEDAGGGPGELGGLGDPGDLRITTLPDPVAPRRGSGDPADRVEAALRAGVLPEPTAAEAPVGEALSGPPLSSGVGVLPGPGLGGGGGSGGGSGGGIGRGVGPGTEFFGARVQARSFAYVIDRSGSMSGYGALEIAKRELMASLELLPPDARFAVFFYNIQTRPISGPDGRPGLRPATAAAKEAVRAALGEFRATGGTEHAAAIRAALAVQPEVIFFLTDGLLMTPDLAAELERAAGRTRIEAISFGTGPAPTTADPVRELATATGGSYRYVDVLRYGKPGGPGS